MCKVSNRVGFLEYSFDFSNKHLHIWLRLPRAIIWIRCYPNATCSVDILDEDKLVLVETKCNRWCYHYGKHILRHVNSSNNKPSLCAEQKTENKQTGKNRLVKRKSYVGKGEKDDAPTADQMLYNLLTRELGFVDACVSPDELDFLRDELPPRCYCNPPYSRKAEFVKRACEESKKGKLIVMLLPADFTPAWFLDAYFNCKASIVIIAGRRVHGKGALFPSMLLVFNGRQEVHIVRYSELFDFLRRYLSQH